MKSRYRILAALCAAVLPMCAFAQQSTISKLVFRNAGPYAQADLENAAGVHAGQKMSLPDMQAAAQRLVDTGCFDNVALDSRGTPNALTLVFVLKPSGAGDIHKISFGNFIWFTQDQLMSIARKVAPLVDSGLPEGGGVLDTITVALQSALAAKGVADAEVGHTLVLPSSGSPVSTIEYRVTKPVVVIKSVTLEGVLPELAPSVQSIGAKLRGKPYVDGPTDSTQQTLLKPYLDAGYLEAQLVDVQTGYTAQKAGVYEVDLKAKVSAGAPYRVSAVNFEGSPLMSTAAFAAGAKLHAGDVASRAQLLASIAPIDEGYHKLGYVDEYVDSGAKLDRAMHTVSFDLKVVPGEIYHLHSVTVVGLSPEARAEFDQGWAVKIGDPYDAEYVRGFFKKNTALRTLNGYVGSFEAAADPATHQVELTVNFVRIPKQ